MLSLIIVGDGAVGMAVAVALSPFYDEVILAGPPGTKEERQVFSSEGYLCGSCEFLHTSIEKIKKKGTVIVALKAFAISDALSNIDEFSDGEILCLSNGMGLEEQWSHLAPRVRYAVLSMGFRKTSPSSVLITEGALYCEKDGEAAKIFKSSGMPVVEVTGIDDMRWAKWYANSIINPIAALTGLANNKLMQAGLNRVILSLSSELAELMPSADSLSNGEQLLKWLLTNSSNRCSMLTDIENGLATEIDYMTGLCEKKLQGKCPTASILVSLIKSKT